MRHGDPDDKLLGELVLACGDSETGDNLLLSVLPVEELELDSSKDADLLACSSSNFCLVLVKIQLTVCQVRF